MTGSELSQKRVFYSASATSIVLSFSMLAISLANLNATIRPIIFANWLAFSVATASMGPSGIFKRGQKVSKRHHNIWRFVILAFSACGLVAVAMGATIF